MRTALPRKEEDLLPPRGMLDEHEAHDDADRAPEQIECAVEQRDALLSVDGAGRLDEVLAPLEAFAQDDFLAVAPGDGPGAQVRPSTAEGRRLR
jgi:hypothetical protein